MIGFHRTERQADNRADEGPDTKPLSKQKLYTMLAEQYLLPSIDSKGVSRSYLLQVHRDQVFRVGLVEYKMFEANLIPSHFKRNGLTSLGVLVNKINRILATRRRNELGFPQHCIPEEDWLIKIARCIDPHNLMEFFVRDIEPLVQLPNNPTNMDRIHVARTILHRQALINPGLMRNNLVYDSLLKVSELRRKQDAAEVELAEITARERRVRTEFSTHQAAVRDGIVKASTLIYSIENPAFRPERLLGAGDPIGGDDLVRLQQIAEM